MPTVCVHSNASVCKQPRQQAGYLGMTTLQRVHRLAGVLTHIGTWLHKIKEDIHVDMQCKVLEARHGMWTGARHGMWTRVWLGMNAAMNDRDEGHGMWT